MKKSISYFECPLSTIDKDYELVHLSNMKDNVIQVDKSIGMSVYFAESYVMNTDPKTTVYNDFYGAVNVMPTHTMSQFSHVQCSPGLKITASSVQDINPTTYSQK